MSTAFVAERQLPLAAARQQIEQELKDLGLTPRVNVIGEHIVCAQAHLYFPDSTLAARGAGKGYLDGATVGALYEALEHYLTDTPHSPANTHFVESAYFSQHPLFTDESLLGLVAQQLNTQLACRNYQSLVGEQHFFYPISLTSPRYSQQPLPHDNFDYRALRRYSSNSGTAIGATREEAILHAINECIERDALSLFMLRHFYYQTPSPLYQVERPAMPHAIARLWTEVEREIGDEVIVLDISSEFIANTYLAFSRRDYPHARLFGSGTSLDGEHAAHRALTELVQLHLASLESDELSRRMQNAQRHLLPFPRLQRCLAFDIFERLHTSPPQTVVLAASASPALTVAEHLHTLLQDLQQHQRTPGVSVLYESARGTTVANVVIPGMERFYIVSSGNVVIPQARGRRIEQEACDHAR